VETNLARARSWLVQQGDVINWDYRGSPDAYVGASTAGLDLFTYDFMAHPRHSVAGALTRLPLPDNAVDIAVCANFLFAYSEMSDATETVSAPRLAQAASSDLLAGVGGTSSSIWPVVHAERRALVEDLVGLEAANITAFTELYRGHPAKWQTALSVAYDLPALMGYDADSPLAEGEVVPHAKARDRQIVVAALVVAIGCLVGLHRVFRRGGGGLHGHLGARRRGYRAHPVQAGAAQHLGAHPGRVLVAGAGHRDG